MPHPENSLYQRWLTIASEQGERVAWRHAGSGESVSFGQLAETGADAPRTEGLATAATSGLDLLVQTLAAWRDGTPLLPLEPGGKIDRGALGCPPDGVAHIKVTSGSTGSPRAVLFSAGQLAADAEQIMSTMRLADHGPNVGVISLAHSYGFSNLVLPLLLHGVPLITADSPLPAAVEAALDGAGGNAILPAVPAMWSAWHSAGILSSARVGLAISAGAPLNVDLERAVFDSTGIKIHNFYGSSECGGIAYDATSAPRQDSTLVGTAMDGVTLSAGECGVLVVSSPAVGTGYWPIDDSETLGAERFVTADLVHIDARDGVHLLGRADDLINVAGRKVSPLEIETELAKLDGVEHCVVFGIPSADSGRVDEIVACVNSSRAQTELTRALQKALPSWQNPKHWWLCKTLMPNARGKISRADWKSRFLAR